MGPLEIDRMAATEIVSTSDSGDSAPGSWESAWIDLGGEG
jgi:hypothetical protein